MKKSIKDEDEVLSPLTIGMMIKYVYGGQVHSGKIIRMAPSAFIGSPPIITVAHSDRSSLSFYEDNIIRC